jgi:hypothetical protein
VLLALASRLRPLLRKQIEWVHRRGGWPEGTSARLTGDVIQSEGWADIAPKLSMTISSVREAIFLAAKSTLAAEADMIDRF